MKRGKFLVLFLLMACSSPKIVYDYDVKTNFSQYKTFDFFEDVGEGLNELDVKRIVFEVEKNLNEQGFKKSDNPDFYINVISKFSEVTSRNSLGIGIGSGGRNVGWGVSGGIPINQAKLRQQLTIDFVESESNDLFWQGISESTINEQTTPQERDVYYQNLIQKIIKGYPPKK
ncbi:DUF4136 domain-containing protein [Tenacibaculum sp. IB213877]|uniref:DUF4136 domain-containing protein n=1 Tax=Tenacibaculum sp. IB213877 TaxID=3097351 RepID=UPI002A598483|nr:DUF4136 domain-containing protein [Tenacibaculum sp. IB213877]MDY0780108.1 DUF4136 domain-containing protein [Tenacibaculum sp. IB213877]